MVARLIKLFNSHNNLGEISNAEWDEYNLSIYGYNWSLNSTSAWRMISKRGFWGCSDTESKTELTYLKGVKIISIEPLGAFDLDFSLLLDNDTQIQIFCTTYCEPWIFNFKNEVTLVPSM